MTGAKTSHLLVVLVVAMAISAAGCGACSGDDDGDPIVLDPSEFTYRLSESPAGLNLWTTPCTRKLTGADRSPEVEHSGLSLSAAGNEFEPVQLILGPASGAVTIAVTPFADLGSGQRIDLATVDFVDGWGDGLTPIYTGTSVELSSTGPAAVWVTVFVPPGAPAGEHVTAIELSGDFGEVSIPLHLYVFDFDLPAETHFATQLNVSVADLIPAGGATEDAKNLLFEHRLTPKSVTWPSGFNWNITWDNPAAPNQCEAFYDEPDEPDQYSIGWLAPRYILGEGWNQVGFANAMLFQFVDNSTPRPASLCGVARGDHYGSSEYNAEWAQFLAALAAYLDDHAMLERGYYYVQNEPQNDDDHALAAHLCRLSKDAAPALRIAISEEPKPEIAETDAACGYDIWIAHVRAYEQDYAWDRQLDHGEAVWFYSLDHDPDPYFNPTRVDSQGMHSRIIPWAAWAHRITGWAYYDAGRFFAGANPGVRAELLREGIEDYEYLWLANGGAHPVPRALATADATALSVASSMTNWSRDADALMALRHELGRYIEGSRADLPVLDSSGDGFPRGDYYLNFQDPEGLPAAEPLVVADKTWIKIGWQGWDDERGWGWYGENISEPAIALYGYDEVAGYDEVERSHVYDDYGRNNLFEIALENGHYEVTVGVGRPQRGYPGDPHNATVEGSVIVDDEVTTDDAPMIVRTVAVDLADGHLSIEVGGRSASTGEWAYTFLAFVEIAAVDP